ncbi:MAG: Uma2 family endonuclease [Bryobacteraceae bacterium]
MIAAGALVTFQEFEQLPDGAEQLEFLQGEVLRMPPPERSHMEIAHRLLGILQRVMAEAGGGTGVGEAYVEMGYLMKNERSWLRPDVSITHRGQPGERYFEDAPALAVEVVSPSDTAAHLESKVNVYLAHGAREVWVVYPESRHVRVYDASGASRREDVELTTPLLPGVSIRLDRFL